MEHRLPGPMQIQGDHPLWRCNAKKEHKAAGVECRELMEKAPEVFPCTCVQCMTTRYPYLEEGPPFIVREKEREKLEREYVGLYEPSDYLTISVPCALCGARIQLDGKTAAKFNDGEEVVHVDCLGDEEARTLHAAVGGHYQLPHIVRAKRTDTGGGAE